MNNFGSTGITAVPLLVSFLIVGATTSSVIFDGTDNIALDAEQTLKDTIDEITTYLKIEEAIGKYYTTNGVRRVEKIVLLIKQFIPNEINISEVKIKISNNNDVVLLDYSGFATESNSKATFENQVWNVTNKSFSLIAILDKDRSLLDYNVMNGDIAFIAIRLPDQFTMGNGDSITISIIPARGIISSIILETPSVHISNIISFGKI